MIHELFFGQGATAEANQVVVVTVTYGNRWKYLEAVLCAVLKQGVRQIIVINNGSDWPVGRLVGHMDDGRIRVVDMQENTGSAGGFAEGMRYAYQTGCEYIWLLDDDNLPSECAVEKLLAVYAAMGFDRNIILLGYRSAWSAQTAAVCYGRSIGAIRNSFLGFHLKSVPSRIVLFFSKYFSRQSSQNSVIAIDYAPYGGLFFSRQWIDRIGYPNEAMYLYFDDREFTTRMTKNGGTIFLCSDVEIVDLETSWGRRTVRSHYWISPDTEDRKVFYAMRNGTYIDYQQLDSRFTWFLNMLFALSIYTIWGLVTDRKPFHLYRRLRLISKAIRSGMHGELGRSL